MLMPGLSNLIWPKKVMTLRPARASRTLLAGSEQGAGCPGRPQRHDLLRPDQVRQPRHQHLQADGRRADPKRRALHRLSGGRRQWQAAVPDARLEHTLATRFYLAG